MNPQPSPAAVALAEQTASLVWGYFKGDSAGSRCAREWFDNNKTLGGPAHIIAIIQSALDAHVAERTREAVEVYKRDLLKRLETEPDTELDQLRASLAQAQGELKIQDDANEILTRDLAVANARAERLETICKEQNFTAKQLVEENQKLRSLNAAYQSLHQ